MYPTSYAPLRQWKTWVQAILVLMLLWLVTSVLAAPTIVTVDADTDNVGQYSSVEINAAGNPVISYHDAAPNNDLLLAICSNPTCTASTIVTLATAGDVGQYTSLELAITPAGAPVVSFFDSLNADLNIVTCSDALCTVPTLTAVDTAGVVGNYTSLALAGNNPVISYYDNGNGDLRLAVCADPTCTTTTLVSPDTGGNVGRDTSIVLNGTNPVISYFDLNNGDLKLLVCNDPLCAGDVPVFLDTVGVVGTSTSVALTAAGNPVISYRDQSNTDLKVAICSNPACTAFTTQVVDNTGAVGSDTSLTLTAGGCPVISYYDATATSLKVAAYSGASCTLVTVTTVDTGGVGQFTSIDLNAAGFPVVSYYDATNGNLKLVTCDTVTCAPLPTCTSTPARTGSTIALTGATGSTQNANIAVTNTGAAGSELDVALISVSAGYTVTGLPIVDQTVGAAAVNINVSCTVPTAAGTLIVETNEPGNPQYTYNLTCTVPAVVPTPTTSVPGSSGGSSGGSSSSSVVVFDPAISKLGFLQPGQSGARGEQIEWMVTVINNGNTDGQNIVVSDTLNADLRIDRVSAPGGTVNTTGQTVTVTYATLAAGQGVQFSIFTTVLRGVEINNTACLTASNLAEQRCSTGRVVREMPATGEAPAWSTLLRVGVLVLLASMSLIGILSYLRRYTKRLYQA